MDTVAEWVGDEQTADYLKDAGITHMQGYLFGQPLLVDDMMAKVFPRKSALASFKQLP